MFKINNYLVGVVVPDYCDQSYLRDRDVWYRATNKDEAISMWLKDHVTWIREEEKKFVKVLTIEDLNMTSDWL